MPGNIERNLYLTTQLVDMHLRMVCAMNMFDEFEQRGTSWITTNSVNCSGVPFIPTVFQDRQRCGPAFPYYHQHVRGWTLLTER